MISDLSIRKTHTYVGTYSHLDKWESIGAFEFRASSSRDLQSDPQTEAEFDSYDACEPMLTEHFVAVRLDEPHPAKRIESALRDALTSEGCAHEHDCCGCRSYRVRTVEHLRADLWRVVVHSSRNY